jgi:hypothetical protein
MSSVAFIAVFLLFLSGTLATSSTSTPSFSSIPSSDLTLDHAGETSENADYSVTAEIQNLRYVGWHVQPPGGGETEPAIFTAACTSGCAAIVSTLGCEPFGLGLFKVTGTIAAGQKAFSEIRFVNEYALKMSFQEPISLDIGHEAFWLGTPSDYLSTLWFVSRGVTGSTHSGSTVNQLWNMVCPAPKPLNVYANSDTSVSADDCNFGAWQEIAQVTTSFVTFVVPPNPAFVSSGGFSPTYGYTDSYLDGRCNVAVISGNDGALWYGNAHLANAVSLNAAICVWTQVAGTGAGGASIASVAVGYDVIWTITNDTTPVMQYYVLGNLLEAEGGILFSFSTQAVPGVSGGWTTASLPGGATPYFVDAFNSTLVYVVDTTGHLWKWNAGSSQFTQTTLPGANQVAIGTPASATPFVPNNAALNVGPDAAYLEGYSQDSQGVEVVRAYSYSSSPQYDRTVTSYPFAGVAKAYRLPHAF